MATETERRQQTGSWGVKWYHVAFALALGVGAGIFPPTGVVTVVGWIGGAVGSLVSALVLGGAVLFVVRWVDDWRPGDLAEARPPDSRFKYLLFTTIGAQLFVLGTALSAGLQPSTTLTILSPLNVLVAGSVLGDLFRLRTRGVRWRTAEFGYPVGALVFGALGGLLYWYRRGRKRVEWIRAETASEPDAEGMESTDASGESTASADAGETQSEPPGDAEPENSGSDPNP
jgi:hypothetical protein